MESQGPLMAFSCGICSESQLKPIPHPFWKKLPYTNIYHSITPDILHQIYQGTVKHLITWIIKACESSEIDTWCWHLPQNHNMCLFMKGISSLSRITGQQHDQISRFLLGLVIDIHLPNRSSNVRLVHSVHAMNSQPPQRCPVSVPQKQGYLCWSWCSWPIQHPQTSLCHPLRQVDQIVWHNR